MTSPLDNGPLGAVPLRPARVDLSRQTDSRQGRDTDVQKDSFGALLFDLQARAMELSRSSKGSVGRNDLREVVDHARATLEDALSLGEQVMEAFNANSRRAAHASQAEGSKR